MPNENNRTLIFVYATLATCSAYLKPVQSSSSDIYDSGKNYYRYWFRVYA